MPNRNKPGPGHERLPVPKGAPKATKAKRGPDRQLTRRQMKFVKELVSNDGLITLREAAIRAGYPAGSASTRAFELTSPRICPHVVTEIARYRSELDEMYGVNYKRHVRDLKLIRDEALKNGAYSASVQAEYRRGQAQGDIYVSKSEVRTGTIDSMSREDVERELERIRAGFEPAIELDSVAVEIDESDSEGGDEPGVGAMETD
jgi:phage terminase small subunit